MIYSFQYSDRSRANTLFNIQYYELISIYFPIFYFFLLYFHTTKHDVSFTPAQLIEYIRCFIDYVFLNPIINANIKHSFFRINNKYLLNTFWISYSAKKYPWETFYRKTVECKNYSYFSSQKSMSVLQHKLFSPPALQPPSLCFRALLGCAGFIGFNFIALNYSENINI